MTGVIHIYYYILTNMPNKFSDVFGLNAVMALFYFFSRHLGHLARVPRRSVVEVSRLGA